MTPMTLLRRGRYAYLRWLYRGGRLNRWGRIRYVPAMRLLVATGLLDRAVMLEVPGRTSGRTIGYPLVLADYQGEQYLVSMLGRGSGWVRNVQANNGYAVLKQRSRQPVRLLEVPPDPEVCAPILKAYLAQAPGARPHFPVDHRAPVAQFRFLVGTYPVFRVVPAG